jgi:hypothetical protein
MCQKKAVGTSRSSARVQASGQIEVKPAIRKYLVTMSPPTLERPIADWERLAKGLETSMGLVRGGEEKLPRWYELNIDYACLRTLARTLRESKWNVTVTVWNDREVISVQPGYHEDSYGAAVDIGSTTVALYLCNLRTGELLAAESEMNPQIVYGEDVMSRIQYTIDQPDGLEKLHKAIIATLNKLLKQAEDGEQAGFWSREQSTAHIPAGKWMKFWRWFWLAIPPCTTSCSISRQKIWDWLLSCPPFMSQWISRQESWGCRSTRRGISTCCRRSRPL